MSEPTGPPGPPGPGTPGPGVRGEAGTRTGRAPPTLVTKHSRLVRISPPGTLRCSVPQSGLDIVQAALNRPKHALPARYRT